MDAELAAVFFCLVLGISVDRIQASSTITGSLPPSSTPALPKASSTESTSSVFRAPSSQVTAVSGSVNSTDLSTTTSLSSSSIVAEISTILASISRNATVSPVTAASLTPSSGISSTSQRKSANLTGESTIEVVTSSVGSLSASASTILTTSSIILPLSQTTSSRSLSSSKRTVSSSGLESPSLGTTLASSSENTSSVFRASISQDISVSGSVNSADLSTTTSPSSSWIVSTSRSVAINTTTSSLKSVSVNSALTTTQTVSSLSFSSTWGLQSGNVTSSFVPSLKNTQSDPTSNSMPTAMLTSPAPSKSLSVDSSSKNVSDATSATLSIGSSVHTVSPSLSSVTTEGFPETVSTTRGTLASTRIYATLSERLSSYPASTPATHTSSPRPTIPPEGTKMVNMEVTLNMEFREDYNDVNSPVYKELVANLSKALFRVYQEVDGFVGVQVLFIRRGSIVCNYIVILASNSKVTDDDLKKELHEGRKDGKFPFDVKGIAVIEDSDAVAAKTKLPQWAMTTMIVLGALSFCFLVIAICACIKYRNAMSSENYIYDVPPGKLDMRAYDAISMGHMRANVDGNTSTAQRRLVSSHENPTYGS